VLGSQVCKDSTKIAIEQLQGIMTQVRPAGQAEDGHNKWEGGLAGASEGDKEERSERGGALVVGNP
jgi:hypothetical protein